MASFEQQQQQRQFEVNTNNPYSTMTNANYVTTTSDHPSTTAAEKIAIAIAYDPELSPIPDQQAYAILDLYGNIIRSLSGGGDIIKDAPTLYKMIVESTSLVLASAASTPASDAGQEEGKGFGLNRMTIAFDNASIRYVIARDENHIYLIQTSTTK